jgi:hypothetical protein
MVGGEQEEANKTAAPPTQDGLEQSDDESDDGTEPMVVLQIERLVDGIVEHSREIQAKRIFGASGDGAGSTETEPEAVVGVEGTTLPPEDRADDSTETEWFRRLLFGASGDGAGSPETEPEAVVGVEGTTLPPEDGADYQVSGHFQGRDLVVSVEVPHGALRAFKTRNQQKVTEI